MSLRAIRQRIAKFGGSFIRQRITPLNGGRSREFRRRLVAVPTCCRRSGATRVIDAGDQGSGNAARVFSAIREVSHGVTGTEARTQTAEGWEPTSAQVSRTALAPPPIYSLVGPELPTISGRDLNVTPW